MIPLGNLGSARADLYYSAVMADSPVAYWRLDESSGATCADSAGSYTGTATGTYTRGVTGLITGSNLALSLGGQGYVVSTYQGQPSALTLEAVIKPTGVTTIQNIIDHDNESNRCFQWRINTSSKLELLWWTPSNGPFTCASSGTLTANQATHVAAVVNSSGATVYINGTGTAFSQSGGMKTSGTAFAYALGTYTSTGVNAYKLQRFSGVLDECAVYASALSSSRILAHAQAAGLA